MKLTAEMAGERHALDIKRDEARVIAEIDGRRYELEAREVEPGVYLLIGGGQVYECRMDRGEVRREEFRVYVGNRDYAITLVDPRRMRGAQSSTGQAGDGLAKIIAPMPGKVVRVLVEVGAQVEAGDGLIVVEAMKMQNEMKSPKAGRVSELHAAPGATVNAGDVLAVVE